MSRSSELISAFSNYALRSRFGGVVNAPRNAAKDALGLYFDLFVKQYRTGGFTFDIPRHLTSRGLRGKFVADTYELPERTLIAKHLPADARVLELGGSLGIVSCHVNRRLKDPKQHVVLEPNLDLISWLTRNRDANGCAFAIENKIVGLGGTAYLQKSHNSDSGQVSAKGATDGADAVETITWRGLEDQYGFQFDTLIADIEGSEYDLLLAFADHIHALRTIIIEMHPRILGDDKQLQIYAQLRTGGFRLIEEMLDTQVWTRA